MEIKAKTSAKKKQQIKDNTGGQVQVGLIQKAAENLAGFLVDKGRAPSDAKFAIRGLYTNGGQKTEFSFGLFVNGKPVGAYRAIPASKKGNKPVRAKSWGQIKGDVKTFDLLTGNNTAEVIKGV